MALTEIKKDELCFALYALSDQLFLWVWICAPKPDLVFT